MKKPYFLLASLLIVTSGCVREETIPTSGIVTLDNVLTFDPVSQSYYAYGFSFPKAEKVKTLPGSSPDITVDSDGTNLIFQTNNYKNSFFEAGHYNDTEAAQEAFLNLTEVNVDGWLGMASPVMADQVWIYRTSGECYAKIRVISVVSEVRDNRDYAECTFEWVFQPDGSTTFPVK